MLKLDTKKILFESLKDLMKQKNFKDIRVSDICNHCGASRSVFYTHFHDKYELMCYEYDQCLKENVNRLCSDENVSIKESIRVRLELFRKDKNFYEKLAAIPSDIADENFIQIYTKYAHKYAKYSLKTDILSEKIQYIIRYHAIAQSYITKDWIKQGMHLSINDLAEIIFNNSIYYYSIIQIQKDKLL